MINIATTCYIRFFCIIILWFSNAIEKGTDERDLSSPAHLLRKYWQFSRPINNNKKRSLHSFYLSRQLCYLHPPPFFSWFILWDLFLSRSTAYPSCKFRFPLDFSRPCLSALVFGRPSLVFNRWVSIYRACRYIIVNILIILYINTCREIERKSFIQQQ